MRRHSFLVFFFFNDTATTEIYTLSLHDALPISSTCPCSTPRAAKYRMNRSPPTGDCSPRRSEEHTSELQSQSNLVCRLLLEKKKQAGCAGRTAGSPPRSAAACSSPLPRPRDRRR